MNGNAPGAVFTRMVAVDSPRGTVIPAGSPEKVAVARRSIGPGPPETLRVMSSKRSIAPPGPNVAVYRRCTVRGLRRSCSPPHRALDGERVASQPDEELSRLGGEHRRKNERRDRERRQDGAHGCFLVKGIEMRVFSQ